MSNIELKFDKLTFGFPKSSEIISNLTFALDGDDGQIIALVGESGCGKTTILKLFAGLLEPKRGHVLTSPEGAIISYLPQDRILFEHLSVRENAEYFKTIKSVSRRFNEATFLVLTKLLNLEHVLDRGGSIAELSGGEQQRLSLLRALSIRPEILLLDEPCTGLDSHVKRDFLIALKNAAKEVKLLCLYVSHHLDEVSFVADSIVFVHRVPEEPLRIISGTLSELIEKPDRIELARYIIEEPTNVIDCEVRDGDLLVGLDYKLLLKDGIDQRIENAEYQLMIPASSIKPGSHEAFEIESRIDSMSYSFIDIPKLSKQKNSLIAAHLGSDVRAIFSGPTWVFKKSGEFVTKVTITPV